MSSTPKTPIDRTLAPTNRVPGKGSENETDVAALRPRFPADDVQGNAVRQDELGVRQRHITFHRFGRRLQGGDAAPPGPYTSALAWSRLDRTRNDYPCCLTDHGDGDIAVPLRVLIGELVERCAPEGEEGHAFEQHAHTLESELKVIIREKSGESLDAAIERAVEQVVDATAQNDDQKTALQATLTRIVDGLDGGLTTLDCTPMAPRAFFVAAAKQSWRSRFASWAAEFDSLRTGIEQMLRTDEQESAEAHDPGRVKSAFGTEAIDPGAMAAIVSTGHLDHCIPESRRERLRKTLTTLDEFRPFWNPDIEQLSSFDGYDIVTTCSEATERLRSRRAKWTEFFRAVWIARLEIKNKYNENAHNAFFDAFKWENLDNEERQLVPPILVALDDDALRYETIEALYGLVQSEGCIKILVEAGDLFSQTRNRYPSAAASLAIAAAATGTAYVLQAPLSHVNVIAKYLPDAYAWPGTALICIYKGDNSLDSDRRFANTAAAAGARLWPIIVSNPAAGAAKLNRVRLDENGDHDFDWPRMLIDCEDARGAQVAIDLPLTAADFILDDCWSDEHFMALPPDDWHEGLRPIDEYFDLAEEEAQTCVPVVWGVDAEGQVTKIIVSREIEDATRHWRGVWRNIQAIFGAHRPGTTDVRTSVEQPEHDEIEDIEKRYEAKLEARTGELAQTIVSRIVARLLGDEGEPASSPMLHTATAPSSPTDSPEPVRPNTDTSAEDGAAVEDEPTTLDEPYIDTSLCTSCNECTQLNSLIFGYDENKQAYIKDASAGPYRDLVIAAEKCPVHIIHPGKPLNPSEPGLRELQKRATPFL